MDDGRKAPTLLAKDVDDDLAPARRELTGAQSLIQAAEATLAQCDAALARRQDTLRLRDNAIVSAGATTADWARLGVRLAQFTATIERRYDIAASQVLAIRKESALRRLTQWVLRRRVLLALLWRAPEQRIAIVNDQVTAMGIAEVIPDRFVHWLCMRRTLIGLLRRSARQGEAALHGDMRMFADANVPSRTEVSQAEMSTWIGQWLAATHAARVAANRWPRAEVVRYYERLGFSASGIAALVALLTTEFPRGTRRTLLSVIAAELDGNAEFAALTVRVRTSAMFDEAFYRDHAGLNDPEADAAPHYLLLGEPLGFAPSVAFDADYYARSNPDVVENGVNCLLHYDGAGRAEGRQPLPGGEAHPPALAVLDHWLASDTARVGGRDQLTASPQVLKRYFEGLGFNATAAAIWARVLTTKSHSAEYREALALAVQDNTALPSLAELVRHCPEFDDESYRLTAGLDGADLDAALHYILVGEPLGFYPSAMFDAAYYARRYPDVVGAGINCLVHYHTAGRGERREPLPPGGLHSTPALHDPRRSNIIFVIHEASRTGSPILGWNIVRALAQTYNIYTIRLDGGPLTPEFEALSVEVHGPFTGMNRHSAALEFGLRRLFVGRAFKYAIVNSIESRPLMEVCARRGVPTVLLMHEFGSYVRPLDSLQRALDLATEIVFPAPIVARSTTEAHPPLLDRTVHIRPQGMSIIPSGNTEKKLPPRKQMQALIEARRKGAFIVIGAGSVNLRKGVDLFIAIAADFRRLAFARPAHFLWIGHGYQPNEDMAYSVYLKEQLVRSGLQDDITFMDEVSDLDPIYDLGHVFLLTSRLDPMPNVSIDAAYREIPMICFRDASGTADLLLADPETASGVVPHLNTAAAAALIARLASYEPARLRMAWATGRLARTVFDMSAYVAWLDQLATATAAVAARARSEAATLGADDGFDQALFLGQNWALIGREQAIAQYLAIAVQRRRGGPNAPTAPLRRAMAGFNPWVWAAAQPSPPGEDADPLADFIRRGRPLGPWLTPVLRPASESLESLANGPRALLHAHLQDPNFVSELLAGLRLNSSACDLLVTTDDEDKATRLRQTLGGYGQGAATVVVVPPCGGCGLWPMLAQLRTIGAAYDVVGHLHGTSGHGTSGHGTSGHGTSGHGTSEHGTSERNFHWQNLVGGQYAMRDRILAAFSEKATLGLVFPSDPYLSGWLDLHPTMEKLRARLGFNQSMPEAYDSPAAGMFWIRTVLLSPLLPLQAAECDDEAAWQAAIVRLIPSLTQAAGLSQAVTHVPGVTW